MFQLSCFSSKFSTFERLMYTESLLKKAPSVALWFIKINLELWTILRSSRQHLHRHQIHKHCVALSGPDRKQLTRAAGTMLIPVQSRPIVFTYSRWRYYLGAPMQCPGEICAFDSVRQLFGCCPLAYLSQPCVLTGTCINYSIFASSCTTGNGCSSSSYADTMIW